MFEQLDNRNYQVKVLFWSAKTYEKLDQIQKAKNELQKALQLGFQTEIIQKEIETLKE